MPLAAGDGAEMTTELPLIPTETIPAPSNDREPAWLRPELTLVVVLPTAKRDRSGFVAAVEADMTIAPAPAAVVEYPTETMPAPDSDTLESVCVVDEVAAVVLPIAY